jgi:prepilin-type N-terminal cleavage/methylation domain-containing protein
MYYMATKKGFTLIELLVVISIIALLMAILMPALTRARNQAKLVVCATRQKAILNAVNLWIADNNGKGLPPTSQGLIRPNGSKHWVTPNRLKYHYGYGDAMGGGSVIDVLGRYMEDPEYFNCPLAQNNVDWQNEYIEKYNDSMVTSLTCSYFLFWNWTALEARGFNPVPGKDTLMVTDFFLSGGPLSLQAQTYGNSVWISSHPLKGSNREDFLTQAGVPEIKLWMKREPQFDIFKMPSVQLVRSRGNTPLFCAANWG